MGFVDVRMSGVLSYTVDGDSATLELERVTNHGTTRSGTLYVSLWFTTSPDPYTPGNLVARTSLAELGGNGTLEPGYSFNDVSLSTDYEPPPDGTYYVHLYVSQYPDLNVVLDLVTFTDTFSQGPNVDIVGTASYGIDGDWVTLGAEWIANNSDTDTTGTLHVTLWLTEGVDPYNEGHRVARASLVELDGAGRLPPGYYYYDVVITTDYEPPPPGTYHVHLFVSQYPELNTVLDLRTFTNTLTIEDDHGDEPFNATVVEVGSFTDGRLEVGGDTDTFRVNLAQSGTLEATTRGSTDTLGMLIGEDYEVVRIDDDGGEGLNFHLEAHVEAGAWYVGVLGYDDTTTGSYELVVDFWPDRTEPAPDAPSRHLGDFDGDGRDDVLLRHADGRWHYYRMNGRHVIAEGSVDLTQDLDYGVAGIGDFNGDGRDDVLLRHRLDGRWHYYPMDGRSYIQGEEGSAQLTKDLDYRVVGIGDFNGDGRDDVLLRHLDGRWYYYPMNGRQILDGRGSANLTKSLDYGIAGVGDFNGDGRDDLLLRHLDGRWYYYPMDGRQVLADGRGSANLTKSLDYGVGGIGDFNGDGRDDVLLRNGQGNWYYYPMNGRRYISGAQGRAALTGDLEYGVAGIGDLNGDGRDDVLLRHRDGSWYYYAMNGRWPISTSQGPVNLRTDLGWSPASLIDRDPGGTITGRVAVTQGQVLDGDTNDPNDPVEDNNTSSSPQAVAIPASVAGYLDKETDDWDFYRMSFPAEVRISLVIAEADNADLDLHLTDLDGTIIAESLGVDDQEVIGTTRTGEHLVAVSAYSGASNYSLVVSITQSASTADRAAELATWSRDGEFVPNELIVRPNDGIRTDMAELLAEEPGLRQTATMPSGAVLTRMGDAIQTAFAIGLDRPGLRYGNAELQARATLLTMRKRLGGNDAFEYAQPNYIEHANGVPNDPHYYYQWHYPQIALPEAWDLTTGDDDVVTAVIDTGVVTDHPDLAGRLLRDSSGAVVGYDFISDPGKARDGDGIDPDPFDAGDSQVLGNASSFHGTHVAGTVGASTNNGIGVAGVTWLGKIMPIRVLGVGGGTTLDIAAGIRYAAGLSNASGSVPPVRADIINLSLGRSNAHCMPLPPVAPVTRDALEDAIDAGVVVVVAAGNDNCRQPTPMSTVDGVITVGATDLGGGRAPYSNFGATVDVVAPGGNTKTESNGDAYPDGVFSTHADDSGELIQHNHGFLAGTSMAAPHVAGVAALMLAANPELTPDDVNRLIAGTHADSAAEPITWDRGAQGRDDDFGHGLIDAYRAVRVAQSIQGGLDDLPSNPILSASPTWLYFGATADVLRTELRNVGTGTLTVSTITTNAPWLSVSLEEWPKLVARVDRTGLDDGTFVGNIAITSDGGDLTVPVTIQVQSVVLDANVGTVYVLALHPDTFETRAFTIAGVRSDYAFEMPTLPRGRYLVVAGTDRDGDGYICDPGEACGMWPLLDSPGIVDIGGDRTLEFGVSMDLFARVTSQSVPPSTVSPMGFSIRPPEPQAPAP